MANIDDRPAKSKGVSPKDTAQKQGSPLDRVNEFATEVKNEFGKIVWPSRKQTVASTAVVVVLVLIMSLYLGTVDLLLGRIIGFILR